MNPVLRISGALLSVLLIAACERGPTAEPAQVTAARQEAAIAACIGRELVTRAEENVESLEVFAADEGTTAATAIAQAAHRFAQAYANHARLRHTAFAYVDSAANHARAPADSARYMQASQEVRVRTPAPETLEANAATAYARDFQAIRTDEDHPCNWDF